MLGFEDSRKKGFTQKRIGVHSFVGTKSKSRKGCDGCRRRKKRCDETHPVCGACLKRNDLCEWSYSARNRASERRKLFPEPLLLLPNCERLLVDNTAASAEGGHALKESDGSLVQLLSSPAIVLDFSPYENANYVCKSPVEEILPSEDDSHDTISTEEVQEIFSFSDLDDDAGKSLVLFRRNPNHHQVLLPVFEDAMDDMFKVNTMTPQIVFTSAHFKYLDSDGCLFWDFYKYKGSTIGCVGVDDYNYFTKCYVKLCEKNEAICNLIAAWGGIYLKDNPDDKVVQSYLRRAFTLFPETNTQALISCKNKRFWAMCFYSVLYMFYVTTGDPNMWWQVFLKLKEIIDLSGGLKRICEDYNYSNDVIFMISLIQYFSCTSSELWISGPIYPLSEFQEVFANVDFSNFGVDPVQGAFHTIYWRLVEVANNKILLEGQRKAVEQIYNMALAAQFQDESLNKEYKTARKDFADCSSHLFNTMVEKIELEQPSICQLELITDETEHQLQIDIFETYKKVCKLCCYFHLKGTTPLAHEVQALLEETLILVEGLLDSKMRVSMIIPLLTCSMAATTAFDKRRIEDCFKRLRHGCAVYNVDLAWYLAQEIWLRNPEGNKIVDWAQICHEKNWHICAC